ncbi:HD domain-containing protein [Candidatus Peregrinibacteria bacterium]|nr:HD domain-containing protein [Candidatus Peregrinibacteria bacterium]
MPKHLFYVAKIMQKILVDEEVGANETKNGITAALLHDVGYLVAQNRYQIDREFQKKEVREAHMKAGAEYARKILKTDPFKHWFNAKDVKIISDIIAVHDYPSLPSRGDAKGRPLNLNNKLSYSLREADRLWMISKYGFMYDLQRMKETTGTSDAQKLFEHTLKRYQEEKLLYKDDGRFKGDTLFRSREAYQIFLKQKKDLIKKYYLSVYLPSLDGRG